MGLKDVAIVNYDLFAGLEGPSVQAMAQFVFDELDRPQIAWIDLTPEETQAIAAISRAIERRLLSAETPLPEEIRRPLSFRRLPADA
jgi:hypothetical protein